MDKPEKQQLTLKIAMATDVPKLECTRAGFPNF